jgi:hypothetical protein
MGTQHQDTQSEHDDADPHNNAHNLAFHSLSDQQTNEKDNSIYYHTHHTAFVGLKGNVERLAFCLTYELIQR